MTTTVTQHPCPKCRGALAWVSEKPQGGAGCLLIVLGLLFTPLLIGIPIFIYGIVLMGKRQEYWHCTSCGTQFPAIAAATQGSPPSA